MHLNDILNNKQINRLCITTNRQRSVSYIFTNFVQN